MKEYDTIYLFCIKKNKKMGKIASQVAHAVGSLASTFPDIYKLHKKNGERALAFRVQELPYGKYHMAHNFTGVKNHHDWGITVYSSVFDRTDQDTFVLAILPEKRLDTEGYRLM